MKKRKKSDAAEAVVEDATNPDIKVSEFDESEDTAVTAAPVELLRESVRPDDWDGPTHEAAAAEMAALAASSAEAGGEERCGRRAARVGRARSPGERAREPAVRQRSAAAGQRSEAPGR